LPFPVGTTTGRKIKRSRPKDRERAWPGKTTSQPRPFIKKGDDHDKRDNGTEEQRIRDELSHGFDKQFFRDRPRHRPRTPLLRRHLRRPRRRDHRQKRSAQRRLGAGPPLMRIGPVTPSAGTGLRP